ncbi:MAG: RND transporter [Proteobacteria bacterium]|nr:MAG: RND transporter [Pseudomonadota bacterium]
MSGEYLSNLLTHKRTLFSLLSLLAIILLGYGAKNLYFKSDYKIFFDKKNPQLVQHEHIESEYTKSDDITFIISTSANDLFNEQDLTALLEFTRDAWKLPYSIRVDSVTNFQNTYAEQNDLIVEDLVPEDVHPEDTHFAQLKKTALEQIELVDFVLSADAKTTSVSVLLQMPDDEHAKDAASHEAVMAARELVQKYTVNYPELSIHLVGQTTVNFTFNELSKRDSGFWFPIMFLAMSILLVLLLKSFSGMIISLIIIIASVISTLGLMGWCSTPLNQVTAALPVIILTLAVCNCVHILNNFYYHLADQQNKTTALLNAMRTNLQPVFLTSLTTVIGFLSMNFSETPPLRELGNWAAIGVTFAFIYSLTLLPFLARLLPAAGRKKSSGKFGQAYSQWLYRKRTSVFTVISLIVIGLLIQIPRNELNDNTIGYFKESVPFRQAADFMQKELTGFDSINYSLACGSSNCVNEPEYLKKVEDFSKWLKQQPEIVHVVSYTDIIKRLNRNMHEGDKPFYTIPESRELSAQYQLLYELSLPFGLDLNNLINVDKSALKVTAIIKNQKAQQLIEIEKRSASWLKRNAPELNSPGAGISLMFAHLGQRNINSMITGSILALVLVTLTLIIALRSLKYGLISLIPNTLPAATAFGIWGVVLAEVNVAVAVVFSFTLGIIVDDTVHFLTKYIRARKEQQKGTIESVEYAMSIVGKAVLVTSAVLGAGFTVLALSDFNVNAYMGAMVAITIILALILDLTLLPLSLFHLDK